MGPCWVRMGAQQTCCPAASHYFGLHGEKHAAPAVLHARSMQVCNSTDPSEGYI